MRAVKTQGKEMQKKSTLLFFPPVDFQETQASAENIAMLSQIQSLY